MAYKRDETFPQYENSIFAALNRINTARLRRRRPPECSHHSLPDYETKGDGPPARSDLVSRGCLRISRRGGRACNSPGMVAGARNQTLPLAAASCPVSYPACQPYENPYISKTHTYLFGRRRSIEERNYYLWRILPGWRRLRHRVGNRLDLRFDRGLDFPTIIQKSLAGDEPLSEVCK